MADLRENEMKKSKEVDFLRGITNGESSLISLGDFFLKYNILSARRLPENTDLDSLNEYGYYYNYSTQDVISLLNKPKEGKIGEMALLVLGSAYIYNVQLYFNITSEMVFIRFSNSAGFKEWKQISFTT